jgi:Zn-dependent peptidase ImmA (M78 family)
VALRTEAFYRTIAGDVVSRLAITEPPVQVEEIAASFGVPVRQVRLPLFFSGSIVYEDGLPVILVNAARDEPVRRRTLAHLVAHVLLVLNDAEGYPRDTSAEHVNADAVARELLMPSPMVLEQARKWFNDYRYLARLFGVGESEMMDKMLDLGIIQQRGIHWQY